MKIATPARTAVAVLALAIGGRLVEAQQPAQVPRSVLERYAGEYRYPAGNTVMVVLRGDTLYREIPGQRVPLIPISETRFKLGPHFIAEFLVEQGGVTQILSDGVATEYRLTRVGYDGMALATPAVAAPVAAVRVPRSVLERYVGVYEYIPGQMSRTDLRVFIRLSGDTLFGAAGQDLVLTPLSETRFRLGSTRIVWEFLGDTAGGVTLVMGTGGQQMRARRTQKP